MIFVFTPLNNDEELFRNLRLLYNSYTIIKGRSYNCSHHTFFFWFFLFSETNIRLRKERDMIKFYLKLIWSEIFKIFFYILLIDVNLFKI